MKTVNQLMKRKGVSPVIATVILVAVAITVSVAVAYWMSGIAGQYTNFEKVEISSAVVTVDGSGNWIVTIDVKNTGTATATIDAVFVNDAIVATDQEAPTAANNTLLTDLTTVTPWQLTSGEPGTIIVWVGINYSTLSSGTTVNVKLHSAAGMDYIKLVKLN